MSNGRIVRKVFAVLTAVTIGLGWGLAPLAAPSAGLGGTILASDMRSPLSGARLHAVDEATGERFVSPPTGSRGVFRLDALPPGDYRVAVESEGALYAVAAPVALTAGRQAVLQLAVKDPPVPPAKDSEDLARKRPSAWNNPGTATVIVIGVAIVLGLLFDESTDSERVASEFVF